MAGIMAVGELGHVMESLLEAVVEQRTRDSAAMACRCSSAVSIACTR